MLIKIFTFISPPVQTDNTHHYPVIELLESYNFKHQ